MTVSLCSSLLERPTRLMGSQLLPNLPYVPIRVVRTYRSRFPTILFLFFKCFIKKYPVHRNITENIKQTGLTHLC